MEARYAPHPADHRSVSAAGSSFSYDIEHIIACNAGPRSVRILYTSDVARIDNWCRDARAAQTGGVATLGLDTESPPNFRPGGSTEVTVLQLAYGDSVLVIQLNAIHAEGMRGRHHVRRSPHLINLITHPSTVVVGMGIAGDVSEIADLLQIPHDSRPAIMDLKRMAIDRGHAIPGGLGPLAEAILGVAKWKSKKLSLSKWGAWPLQDRQVVYAAMDAWASCALHGALLDLPVPPPPAAAAPPPEEASVSTGAAVSGGGLLRWG